MEIKFGYLWELKTNQVGPIRVIVVLEHDPCRTFDDEARLNMDTLGRLQKAVGTGAVIEIAKYIGKLTRVDGGIWKGAVDA